MKTLTLAALMAATVLQTGVAAADDDWLDLLMARFQSEDEHDDSDEENRKNTRPVYIKKAEWKKKKSRLEVKGKGSPGETVTLYAPAGRLLGEKKLRDDEWKFKLTLNGQVPCKVRAEQSDGSWDVRRVKNAPSDCDDRAFADGGDDDHDTGGGNGGGNGGGGGNPPPVVSGDFTVLAANDLGMHCADQDYRIFSILPPYNVIHAQVLRKGDEPDHMGPNDGIRVTYKAVTGNIVDSTDNTAAPLATDSINTTSENDPANGVFKTNFWEPEHNAGDPLLGFLAYDPLYPSGVLAGFPLRDSMMGYLLGLPAPDVERLYLGDGQLAAEQATMPGKRDPFNANDPQPFHGYYKDFPFFVNFPFGYTVTDFKRFVAEGIPITPVDDRGRKNAYPLLRVEARDHRGNVLAQTDVVTPVASEADCQSCHLDADVCTSLGVGFACDDIANYYSNADFVDGTNINTSDPNDPHYVPGDTDEQIAINAAKINILRLHDERNGTDLDARREVVCATCHYSPALDLAHLGPNDDNGKEQTKHKSMSRVMHGFHGSLPGNRQRDPEGVFADLFPIMPTSDKRTPEQAQAILEQTCYACHPGKRTACLRGAMAEGGMVCQDCHGQSTQVGEDFSRDFPGSPNFALRMPWANEPKCQGCHLGDVLQVKRLRNSGRLDNLLMNARDVQGNPDGLRARLAYALPEHVDNGGDTKLELSNFPGSRFAADKPLYRLSKGHGGVFCEGCHGSTHAIWPNANPFANDNRTAEGLQGHSGTIIECSTCHTGDLGNTLKGPHGMHPVGDTRFARGGHEDVAERNKDACRACHGMNGEGTVLSRTAADRTLWKDDDGKRTIFLAKGTPVRCNHCHENEL